MERELIYLLHDLCVNWGFCIPEDDMKDISTTEHYHAIDFAKDVIASEGMDPEHEAGWLNRIAGRFEIRFGATEIESTTFSDRVRGVKEDW